MTHTTREGWLTEAVQYMTELYAQTKEDGEPVRVPPVRISVGFPATGNKRTTRGTCHPSKASADGVTQIFISPILGPEDSLQILATLIHEMAHAIDDCESGHTGRFRKLVTQMGLQTPVTSATASPELNELLGPILDKLGEFPHAKINMGDLVAKKQATKMLKLTCQEQVENEDEPGKIETCGYLVRTTQIHITRALPKCPIHDLNMELEEKKAKRT